MRPPAAVQGTAVLDTPGTCRVALTNDVRRQGQDLIAPVSHSIIFPCQHCVYVQTSAHRRAGKDECIQKYRAKLTIPVQDARPRRQQIIAHTILFIDDGFWE